MALLVRPDQVHSARLVERIARNDGVFLAYFLDAHTANAWLRPVKIQRETLGRKGVIKSGRCAPARSQTTESAGMPRTPNAGARFRDPRVSRSVWIAAHSAALPHPDLITPRSEIEDEL